MSSHIESRLFDLDHETRTSALGRLSSLHPEIQSIATEPKHSDKQQQQHNNHRSHHPHHNAPHNSYNYHHSNNHNNHSNHHNHSHRKKGVKRHGNIHITTKEVQFSSFDKETESVQQELKNHMRSHHTKARSSVSNAKRLMNTLQLKRETKRKEKLKDKLKSGIAKMNISRTVAAAQKVRKNMNKKRKTNKIINCNFFFCMNETIFFVSFQCL